MCKLLDLVWNHTGFEGLLTLWELVYDMFIPRIQPKSSSFWLHYQRHSSSADCARELFKGSNGSASLLLCTWKNILVGGCGFFVSDVISEVVFGPFWLMLPGLGPNCYTKVFRWSFHYELGSTLVGSSKVSKDLDCSLVSCKNFSKMLSSNVLISGPGEVGQGGLTVLHLWHHTQKICTPNQKIFLSTN